MVFAFSAEKLDVPYHIYPLDSGAAVGGFFDDRADPHVYLEDDELTPKLDSIQHHIAWAFGDNARYFDGDIKTGLTEDLPNWKFTTHSYIKIAGLASTGNNRPDKRASAIEVAYRDNISLMSHVNFSILPEQFLEEKGQENSEMLGLLDKYKIEWRTYRWSPNETPAAFMDQIASIMRRRLQDIGQIP
jgi:hypothetical protein